MPFLITHQQRQYQFSTKHSHVTTTYDRHGSPSSSRSSLFAQSSRDDMDDDDDDDGIRLSSRNKLNNIYKPNQLLNNNNRFVPILNGNNRDINNNNVRRRRRREIVPSLASAHNVYSPYDFLYPDALANHNKINNNNMYPKSSLYSSLQLLQQALQTIVHGNCTLFPPNIVGTGTTTTSSATSTSTTIIRIEVDISHDVDPLCWLQAQTMKHKQSLLKQDEQRQPIVYFASAEGTFDAAAFGSTITYKGTSDEEEYWCLVQTLPDSTHLYGGQRFDTQTTPSIEWEDFATGFWILPAVEIRRQPMDTNYNDNDDHDPHQNHEPTGTTTKSSFQSTFDNPGTSPTNMKTTVAVHLSHTYDPMERRDGRVEPLFSKSAKHVLQILNRLTDATTPKTAPTTLPPVLSRESSYGPNKLDAQEIYEQGVMKALDEFQNETSALEKVVLARRMDLIFGKHAEMQLSALDVLRRWKFGSKPGGHLFYIDPGQGTGEFFGCTPERLFQLNPQQVSSEALAGTRPRGQTQQADEELARELFESQKDQAENQITGKFIHDAFEEMHRRGWVIRKVRDSPTGRISSTNNTATANDISGSINLESNNDMGGRYFVRRLRHLQHICRQFRGQLRTRECTVDVARFLLSTLHPTPAMGGFPKEDAVNFIREHETIGFDRGFYSGPVGYVGRNNVEIVAAIRSALMSSALPAGGDKSPTISVYAGAGLVPGSTVLGEWAETSYKLAVVTSIFPQSPITLQESSSPNSAWSTAFVEELIRNGVTHFYICPGSRSTPLVAAVARAVRSNVGVVHAVSIHDERGAGFRAVGYGRGASRPAAIITSSGTAIANLYPAVVEAGMDGVPLLLLTADRPYENRDTGANQAIDQVKAYSASYVRWFRDILPPNDDVPVSAALADAAHAVRMTRKLRGPVHINIQFRENLAPEGGPIRNDNRVGSLTSYDAPRFTDAPGFQRWSVGGGQWRRSYTSVGGEDGFIATNAVADIASLISKSSRGLIVVGNLRTPTDDSQMEGMSQTGKMISDFAQSIGFPIVASIQSGSLRFDSPAVIPFAEHVLRHPLVQRNLKPDLILQFGSPLLSTAVPNVIATTMRESDATLHHVLVHPHHPHERADPDFTVTHQVDAEISPFLKALSSYLAPTLEKLSSNLSPLILLGTKLQSQMPSIIDEASKSVMPTPDSEQLVTEPEVLLSMAEILSDGNTKDYSLFLSNSMPVRDADSFLYPLPRKKVSERFSLRDVGVNRGASGIDGVIASATGFAESTDRHTTLLIGDVAALHDINSLHTLRASMTVKDSRSQRSHPLATIVLNNDGGGIFSFLPVARHSTDVAFEEFFGTPTSSFSFPKAAEAFDVPFHRASNNESFWQAYMKAMESTEPSIIEVMVAPRSVNVAVHREIDGLVGSFIDNLLSSDAVDKECEKLPVKVYARDSIGGNVVPEGVDNSRTLVLLHGWMGDKSEWDEVGANLVQSLPFGWSIIAIDLPGHGQAQLRHSSGVQAIRKSLQLPKDSESIGASSLSVDQMARTLLESLNKHHGIQTIDALAGYSLGGRVALAIQRICKLESSPSAGLVKESTKIILLSAYPGDLRMPGQVGADKLRSNVLRTNHDDKLARDIEILSLRGYSRKSNHVEASIVWSGLLQRWYSSPLWGRLNQSFPLYCDMIEKRIIALSTRGADLAVALRECSPPRCRDDDWQSATPENTLFISGGLDSKYTSTGKKWQMAMKGIQHREVPHVGHAVLAEAPSEVSEIVSSFLLAEHVYSLATRPDPPPNPVTLPSLDSSTRAEAVSLSSRSSTFDEGEGCGVEFTDSIGSLDYEAFVVDLAVGVSGIGWGNSARALESNKLDQRSGFIIQVLSTDRSRVGVGEVSPLRGVHKESFDEAGNQLQIIASRLEELSPKDVPCFDATRVLSLDGEMTKYIDLICGIVEVDEILPSVRSGLEMAILSLGSQTVLSPIHQALVEFSSATNESNALMPVNGLVPRGSVPTRAGFARPVRERTMTFPSMKVKVGHREIEEDAGAISQAYQLSRSSSGVLRADANQAWDYSDAQSFVIALASRSPNVAKRIEFIEEPLRKQESGSRWSLSAQVDALEQWHSDTGIPYALDESISDVTHECGQNFEAIQARLRETFPTARGCAALILKPTLLGMELSVQLARFARQELGLGAVFTSTFDSGVGLSFISFIGSVSDMSPSIRGVKTYPHGVGTFSMLSEDSISPSFGSYVNEKGLLNIASLSRAFYGLGLDEIRDSSISPPDAALSSVSVSEESLGNTIGNTPSATAEEFEASIITSSSGREISVVASLPLPFSADTACSRFTDLPQQPRWSPWISSVAYLDAGSETEWTLRVRGVNFRWRATSSLLDAPLKGIRWESISGLKNTGVVEFTPTGGTYCSMSVRMTIIAPRILYSLFKGTAGFFDDFLRNKLIKWSLEMFRDVVKGDLALEEGDVQLGDALFGAVEGKASAIEATLSFPMDGLSTD